MYNPERKKDFIDSYTGITSYNYIQNLFNKCEPVEKQLDKDVCDFIKPEIVELLASFSSFSEGTLKVYKSMLKQYTDFCCENNLSKDNINHYEEIGVHELKKYTNQFFNQNIYITRERLDEWCNELENPVDAYIIYCLFEGIKGDFCEEITDMKLSDINKNKTTVNLCTGRKIVVSEQFINVCEKTDATTFYKSVRPYKFSDSSLCYLFKTKYDRTLETMQQKRAKVFKKIVNIKELLDAPELSISNLYNSGLVYYLTKRIEETGMSIRELVYSDDEEYKKIYDKYNIQRLGQYTSYAINSIVEKYLGAN